jgi:glycosyltransferase involved in cell wall biosynthesis
MLSNKNLVTGPGSLDLFTIVIPYYNCASYLGDCLESLRKQTYDNWQAIVVDDGSSDCGAATILEHFGDPRVQVVQHTSNRGQAAALNTGFGLVQSEYVLSVDADDAIDPAYLESVARVLEADPNLDCVFTDLKFFGDRTGVLRKKLSFVPNHWGSIDLPAGAGAVMRRSLWERVGGYCEARDFPTGPRIWTFGWQLSAVVLRHTIFRSRCTSIDNTNLAHLR